MLCLLQRHCHGLNCFLNIDVHVLRGSEGREEDKRKKEWGYLNVRNDCLRYRLSFEGKINNILMFKDEILI